MPIPWRTSAEVFARILRGHGANPDHVVSVSTAWTAFAEFLQMVIDGVDGATDLGDGFSLEWGRWNWNHHRPSLSFRRLLGVSDTSGPADSQPDYRTVELVLLFAESPAWEDLGRMESQGTGFEHHEVGAARNAALAAAYEFAHSYPQVAAIWRAEPVRSQLTLERV